jgi:arylsulfatase
MATLLDVAGIPMPDTVDGVEQQPLDGMSMRYSFDNATAATHKKVQYFELWGNRGIWADGWKAVVLHNPEPWNLFNYVNLKVNDSNWELYHSGNDFNELNNLAATNPTKLEEMKQLFDAEARGNYVYPLTPNSAAEQETRFKRIIEETGGRFVYRGGAHRLPESIAPPIQGRSFTIEADVEPNTVSDTGIIVAVGGAMGGYSLYLKDGVPAFCYNSYAEFTDCIHAKRALAPGKPARVRFEFDYDHSKSGLAGRLAGGKGTLYVDSREVGEGVIRRTNMNMFSVSETFDLGQDDGSAVSPDYNPATPFPGKIGEVVFRLDFDQNLN